MLCSLPKKKEFPCLYGKRTSLCVHCCALVISGEPSTDLCLCWTLHVLLDVCRYLPQCELRDPTTRALLPKSQFPFLLIVGTWLGGFASERTTTRLQRKGPSPYGYVSLCLCPRPAHRQAKAPERGASSVLCLTTKGWRKVGFSGLLIHFGTARYFRLL